MKEVVLTPLSLDDIDFVMGWINDPEVTKNFQRLGSEITREAELEFLRRLIGSENDHAYSVFTLDAEYVGQAAVNQISWENKLGRLSLFIKPEFWGQGYAQAVIPHILDIAFNKLCLHKVWLMVYASNEKALHLYEKLGFSREGVLREEYYWHGEYQDMVRMSILDREYRGQP